LFFISKAVNISTSSGFFFSLTVLSFTYITPFAFLLSLSYITRRTYAPVRSSKLSCSSAVGTTVANGSDFALKSQPCLVQKEQYIQAFKVCPSGFSYVSDIFPAAIWNGFNPISFVVSLNNFKEGVSFKGGFGHSFFRSGANGSCSPEIPAVFSHLS